MNIRKSLRRKILPLDKILETFEKIKVKECLDIGAGTGIMLEFFYDNKIIEKGTGIEVSPRYVRKINDNLQIQLPENLDKNKKYDLLTIVDVLHHVGDKESFLKDYVDNYLDKDGYLYIKDMNPKNIVYKYFNKLHDLIFAQQVIHEITPNDVKKIIPDLKQIEYGEKRVFLYDHYWFLFQKI